MSRPAKSGDHKRLQGAAVLLRMHEDEKRYMEAAAAKKQAELSKEAPGAKFTIAPLLRNGGMRWAREILGLSMEEFRAAEKKGKGGR